MHGVEVNRVHFHEVGAVDSIIDTVGSVLALHLLNVEELYASELPLSQGLVDTQHGLMSVPAPATMHVLSGTGAIFHPSKLRGELVTPTGASILAALCHSFRNYPNFSPISVGLGAGDKEFTNQANVVRIVIGEKTMMPRTTVCGSEA